MKILSRALFALLLSHASSQVCARSVLNIHSSTMSAGGAIQMPITVAKGHDALVGLSIAPTLEYFATRTFAFGFAPLIAREAISGRNSPWHFSMSLTGTYYFDLRGALYPYVGALGGIGWQTQKQALSFQAGIPVGVLVALNNHVALKFGIPITFHFNTDGYVGTDIPIGYVGVQAFF